jgi:hypothetical protein
MSQEHYSNVFPFKKDRLARSQRRSTPMKNADVRWAAPPFDRDELATYKKDGFAYGDANRLPPLGRRCGGRKARGASK